MYAFVVNCDAANPIKTKLAMYVYKCIYINIYVSVYKRNPKRFLFNGFFKTTLAAHFSKANVHMRNTFGLAYSHIHTFVRSYACVLAIDD